MGASTLTVRIDSGLKEETAKVVENYGLDLSSVIRAFFTEIVSTESIRYPSITGDLMPRVWKLFVKPSR